MKKIKIFTALDDLDTYELNRFEKYVNSPYFNSSAALVNIVTYYETQRKKGKREYLDKSILWKSAFPSKEYSDGRIRKALSDLLKLYEDFLCQELLEQKPIQRATLLMEAVEQRKLDVLYNSSMKRAGQLTKENTDASAQLHYHRYEVEKLYYELSDLDIKRNQETNLSQIISNLDHFYLAEKLKYYCTSLSRTSFYSENLNLLFIEEIKEHIAKTPYVDVPIVNIWITIYKLQSEIEGTDQNNYVDFKNSFKSTVSKLPLKDALQIFTYGQNYCANKINKGQQQYFQEIFDLNKIALENDILIQHNQLDPWLFRNIVTVALRLKEFEWTKIFITSYGQFINENFRRNAVSYAEGALSFYLGQYEQVLTKLNEMKVMDISYELNSKSLLIMTYFEMKAMDVLSSLLDSFSVYLNRNKNITKGRKELYLNMISFTRRLLNTLPSDKTAHEKMLAKLEETKGIASGAWLKEKILERLN